MEKTKSLEILIGVILIFIGAALRLLPHPPNFTSISAIALFGGVYLSKRLALILPILSLLISDIFLGFYTPLLMLAVYLSFILVVILGFWLKKQKKWYTILGSSILGSILFFVITNFAVWVFTNWYPGTISGLIECYIRAIPFFKNSLMGDLFYVTIFFGIYEILTIFVKNIIFKPAPVSEKI